MFKGLILKCRWSRQMSSMVLLREQILGVSTSYTMPLGEAYKRDKDRPFSTLHQYWGSYGTHCEDIHLLQYFDRFLKMLLNNN